MAVMQTANGSKGQFRKRDSWSIPRFNPDIHVWGCGKPHNPSFWIICKQVDILTCRA